jgi:putative ABC transport system ATP-binding protein
MGNAIELINVWKHYANNVPILKGVNLSVPVGSFISIRGKSGAGKTTLIRLIGMLDRPTSGSVFILGSDTSRLDDGEASQMRLKHIGFIFQSFNLIPSLTVLENIELPMALLGVAKEARRRRAVELLERFHMERLADRFPSELSGGEQQRVAILRAIANNPDIILADEPTSNLDEENSQLVYELLSEINRENLTTIVVTEVSLEERLPTSRDYLLKNGVLYRLGP